MQTPENVLGALVKQIVRELGGIPDEIGEAFRNAKGQIGGRGLWVPGVLTLLKVSLASLKQAFICIDALDELLVKHLLTLLRSLYNISQSFPGVYFHFTCRPNIGIEGAKHLPGAARFIHVKAATQHILRYAKVTLDDDFSPEATNATLRAEIMSQVSETLYDVYAATIFNSREREPLLMVSPKFLLVSLNVAAILALLLHASSFSGHYVANQTTEGVKSIALQLLDGFDSHISANLL